MTQLFAQFLPKFLTPPTLVTQMQVEDLMVEVRFKPVKHAYLLVKTGQVRVTVPLTLKGKAEEFVHDLVSRKMDWIRRQLAKKTVPPAKRRPAANQPLDGTSALYLGAAYQIQVTEVATGKRGRIRLDRAAGLLHMTIPANTPVAAQHQFLEDWYRQQLQALLPDLVARWQAVVGVSPNSCQVRRMITRWGSCNVAAARIWLSLELVKKPLICVEYVLVHELVHLHERHHNQRFYALMDEFMPDWRRHRDLLNPTSDRKQGECL
jgi:predicted metal-dependent hydrolase